MTQKPLLQWTITIASIVIVAVVVFVFMVDFYGVVQGRVGKFQSATDRLVLPLVCTAVAATVIVILLGTVRGTLAFSALGFEFSGPAGPSVIWSAAFIVIAVAGKILGIVGRQ